MSILIDDDILHCLPRVLSFNAWDEEKSSEAVTDGEGAQRPVLRVIEP